MQILQKLGPNTHPDLLAGSSGFEDAGILRLDSERALVMTTDFFPPVVDDPRWFGRIAAANALSDVYAMGGEALAALNIVGWPDELDRELLGEVLIGGKEKIEEAGAALAGGHSVRDSEVKYGLAVTGVVHPERYWSNSGAKEGDALLATKAFGTSVLATALKRELFESEDDPRLLAAMESMATLNLVASRSLIAAGVTVHAATDVTGFGLFGHGREMAEGCSATLQLDASQVRCLPGALEFASEGVVSGGGKRARARGERFARIDDGVDENLVQVTFDAETSGGLLVAVPEAEADQALRVLREAGVNEAALVGRFVARVDDWSVRMRKR